jgi:hypothetical protein
MINELGSKRFAEETEQSLVDFFSNDTLTNNVEGSMGKPAKTRKKRVLDPNRSIPAHRQEQLWAAHPSSSDHIPGKLSLCLGLPVMIRHNEAAELCITKGQEGHVVGWEEAKGNQDQRILDTLFVAFMDPPKKIQIPGLPDNVVPLSKSPKTIWCSLPGLILKFVQITSGRLAV